MALSRGIELPPPPVNNQISSFKISLQFGLTVRACRIAEAIDDGRARALQREEVTWPASEPDEERSGAQERADRKIRATGAVYLYIIAVNFLPPLPFYNTKSRYNIIHAIPSILLYTAPIRL